MAQNITLHKTIKKKKNKPQESSRQVLHPPFFSHHTSVTNFMQTPFINKLLNQEAYLSFTCSLHLSGTSDTIVCTKNEKNPEVVTKIFHPKSLQNFLPLKSPWISNFNPQKDLCTSLSLLYLNTPLVVGGYPVLFVQGLYPFNITG